MEVADQGPGIAPADRARLFTRFARTDSARSPEDGGAGLGLALSAAIATAHGGTLELVASGAPGATFRLHLPNNPTAVRQPRAPLARLGDVVDRSSTSVGAEVQGPN